MIDNLETNKKYWVVVKESYNRLGLCIPKRILPCVFKEFKLIEYSELSPAHIPVKVIIPKEVCESGKEEEYITIVGFLFNSKEEAKENLIKRELLTIDELNSRIVEHQKEVERIKGI
jgi:hypothetical protein